MNRVEIHNLTEWNNVDKRVTELVIPSKSCNESEWSVFDVSELKELKRIEIGDDCFENVEEVKLVGLPSLERVVMGKKNFTKCKLDWPRSSNPNRHFYLKDCESLKELKIGFFSFADYSVCEIVNVPSLEVIEMEDAEGMSYSFLWASLELKSAGDGVKS